MQVKRLSDILSTVNIKVVVKRLHLNCEQFPYIRQLLDAYHIKRYELDNYEADDIIGTLSRQADEEDFETIIITGDRDLTQLATDNVTIYYTKRCYRR